MIKLRKIYKAVFYLFAVFLILFYAVKCEQHKQKDPGSTFEIDSTLKNIENRNIKIDSVDAYLQKNKREALSLSDSALINSFESFKSRFDPEDSTTF